jgi:hypothetical protein
MWSGATSPAKSEAGLKKKQDLVCMCVFTKCKPTNPSKREKEEQQRSVRESERKKQGGAHRAPTKKRKSTRCFSKKEKVK